MLPAWADGGRFLSITRSAEELSIVAEEPLVPPEIMAERGMRCLRVRGTMAFETTGVAAAIAAPLAEVGVSLLIIATYDTDYVLVKETTIRQAIAAWRRAGIAVSRHGRQQTGSDAV